LLTIRIGKYFEDILEMSETSINLISDAKIPKFLLMSFQINHNDRIHHEIFQKLLVPPGMKRLLSGQLQ